MSAVSDTSGVIMEEDQTRVPNDLVSLNIYIFSGKVEVRWSSLQVLNLFTVVGTKRNFELLQRKRKQLHKYTWKSPVKLAAT